MPAEEPSRYPEKHEPPRYCVKSTCDACWREAASKAVNLFDKLAAHPDATLEPARNE